MDSYEDGNQNEHEEHFDAGEYAKGFNWGYIIGEHDSSLANDLMNSLEPDGGRASGLIEGFREFFREREQDRMKDLESLRSKGIERDLDR